MNGGGPLEMRIRYRDFPTETERPLRDSVLWANWVHGESAAHGVMFRAADPVSVPHPAKGSPSPLRHRHRGRSPAGLESRSAPLGTSAAAVGGTRGRGARGPRPRVLAEHVAIHPALRAGARRLDLSVPEPTTRGDVPSILSRYPVPRSANRESPMPSKRRTRHESGADDVREQIEGPRGGSGPGH